MAKSYWPRRSSIGKKYTKNLKRASSKKTRFKKHKRRAGWSVKGRY